MTSISYQWTTIFEDSEELGYFQTPVIAPLGAGNRYLVAWEDDAVFDARARVFDGGVSQGDVMLLGGVNTRTMALTQLADGGAVLVYGENDQGPTVSLRRFDSNGAQIGFETHIDGGEFDDREPDVAGMPDGRFVVTWSRHLGLDNPNVMAAIHDADGTREITVTVQGSPLAVTTNSSVAALAAGGFVVCWQQEPLGGGDSEVYFRRYNAAGDALDPAGILIDTAGSINEDIQVEALPDGGFIVAYTDNGWNGGISTDITLRIYNADGSARTGYLRANALDTVDQVVLRLAVLPNGFFVVSYYDDAEGYVRQVYDAEGHAIGAFPGGYSLTSVGGGMVASLGSVNTFVTASLHELTRTTLGDAGSNIIAGDTLRDIALGGGGNDWFTGVGGDDSFTGGPGVDVAHFSGNRSDFSVIRSANGEVLVRDLRDGSPDGQDTLHGVESLVFADGMFAPVAPLGEVLWWNDQGAIALGDHYLGSVSTAWQIAGADDFDGDSDADILWRHNGGQVVVWEMQGGAYVVNHNLANVSATWQVRGTGDFDGDGDADILWHNSNGQVVTWEMQDGDFVVNHNLPSAGTTWNIYGTGDFDRDGDADILWRNDNGQVVTWEMQDGAYAVHHNLPSAGATWSIRGTGDFDADGDADILWRNSDGRVVTWEMEAGAYAVNHNLGTMPTSWQVAGTGDLDHDGAADILWRDSDGSIWTWHMQDGLYDQTTTSGLVGSDWQVRAIGDFGL